MDAVVIIVLLVIIALLLITAYALMVVAHDADERAEEMYKAWKESKDEQIHRR